MTEHVTVPASAAEHAQAEHAQAGPLVADELLVEAGPLVADELLVEEVSIDGMCGVY
jgi:mycofactocin precursor